VCVCVRSANGVPDLSGVAAGGGGPRGAERVKNINNFKVGFPLSEEVVVELRGCIASN
jgi:hypothetical protein